MIQSKDVNYCKSSLLFRITHSHLCQFCSLFHRHNNKGGRGNGRRKKKEKKKEGEEEWGEPELRVQIKFCCPYALTVQKFRLLQHFVLSPKSHESQKFKSYVSLNAREGLTRAFCQNIKKKFKILKRKKILKKRKRKKKEREKEKGTV